MTKLQKYEYDNTLVDRWYRLVGLDVPLALTAKGWRDWRTSSKATTPIRYWLGWELPSLLRRFKGRLRDAWWWIRHRTTHRYHILDLRRGAVDGSYRAGWIDTDTQLEYANVALVRNFVEQELPAFEKAGWSDNEYGYHIRAKKLYDFWMVRLPGLRKEQDDLDTCAFGRQGIEDSMTEDELRYADHARDLEVQISEEIEAAIVELAAIRHGLWT